MQQAKRIVIIAGEESGDKLAASFIQQLKMNHQNLEFSGIGGKHMQNAGVPLISDLASFSVTGLTEILRHLSVFRQAFKAIKAHLTEVKPDLLILVDYPAFNLRLAKFAKRKLGLRILYYISPQVWAWKANRIKTIRDCIDHMAVILPFEKKLYEHAGVPVSFVGHPLVGQMVKCEDINATRAHLGLPQDKRLIAMLPGSRVSEIEQHLPVLHESAKILQQQFDDIHFVIPIAGTINPELIQSYLKDTPIPVTLVRGQARETIACSDCVVVASGTASLECALLEKPMCIIYKSSVITYMATLKFIKVKYLGLCNLLQNEMVVPELLQYDCNPIEIARTIKALLNDKDMIQRMQARLHRIKVSLSGEEADDSIDQLIEKMI